jgi:hypothetical protein
MLGNARSLLGKIKALQAGTPDSSGTKVTPPSDVGRLVVDQDIADLRASVPLSIVTTDIGAGVKGVVVVAERQIKAGKEDGATYTISGQTMLASTADLKAAGGFDELITRVNNFYDNRYGPKPAALSQGIGMSGRGALKGQGQVTKVSDAPKATAHASRTDFSTHI